MVAVKYASGSAQSDADGFFEESSSKNMLMKFGVDSVHIRWSRGDLGLSQIIQKYEILTIIHTNETCFFLSYPLEMRFFKKFDIESPTVCKYIGLV